MLILNWPSSVVVDKRRDPYYEFAYLKAALEGSPNTKTFQTYEEMYGKAPKAGTPYWLVRLAIYYGGLQLGYTRFKRPMPTSEAAMLACLNKLDEKELQNNRVLRHKMYLHDVEPAEFGGRELVERGQHGVPK